MAYRKLSDNELEGKLCEFDSAIKVEENIPENTERVLLMRFLKFFNGNVEKALKRLISSMELRKSYPNIFYNRDTLKPSLRKLIDQVEMVPLPKVTSDNNRILLLRLIDFDPDNLVFDDALTVFSMVYDVAMITADAGKIADGEIVIFEFNGAKPKHLTKLNISFLRCFVKYMIEAHPVRIKQVHVVNTHALLDKLVMMMKPFLGAKAMKVIHFHQPNSTTLYDYVSRDLLPIEFGGNSGSIEEPKWYWINRTDEHRDYLLDDDRWKFKNEKIIQDEPFGEAFNYLGFC